MSKIKVGDVVCRKSYGSDVIFKVVGLKEQDTEIVADLKGVNYRLLADAPECDLEVIKDQGKKRKL